MKEKDPKQEIGFYEFDFPKSDDFCDWITHMLDHPKSWNGWISKKDQKALFNQIIQREEIKTRVFPPSTPETKYGVYVISDENEVLYIGKSQDKGSAVVWRLVDHFFPYLPYSNKYNNIKRMQNTPWLWEMHLKENKKLHIFYCDNISGILNPKQAENYLRKLFYENHGDYPKYDGHSSFTKQNKHKYKLIPK